MIDARKHDAFGPAEQPSRQAFNNLSLSINDIIPVANTTERAQVINDLVAAGAGPTSTRPVYVDVAGVLWRTTDGTTWGTLLPAFPYWIGTRTAPSSVASATGGDGTLITWATTETTGGITNSAGTLTVPVAGVYHIDCWLAWAPVSGGDRLCRMKVNGSFTYLGNTNPSTTTTTVSGFSVDAPLGAGAQLQVFARQNTGSAIDVTPAYTYFNIRRVR